MLREQQALTRYSLIRRKPGVFRRLLPFLCCLWVDFPSAHRESYRIQREYFKGDGLGDKDNGSGEYHVSQNLICKVQTQEHIPFRLSIHTVSGTVRDAVFGVFGKTCDRVMKNGMQDVKTDSETLNQDFRIRADDVPKAECFLDTHWQRLTELRDSLGQFLLEYTDDMLTLSFSDFAPIDAKGSYNVRRTGLPNVLRGVRKS